MNSSKKPIHSVFITGASSGIGAALAQNYANSGITLFLGGRNIERLEQTAAVCRQKGATVHIFPFDVTDASAAEEAVLKADSLCPIDLLIANAGVSGGMIGTKDITQNTRTIFNTNIFGVVNTVLPIIKRFQQRQNGQIAIMSSMAGYRGLRNCPAYSASKNCVKAWGEALRGRLEKDNIRVNVICPGFIKTPLTDANRFKMPLIMSAERAAQIMRNGIEKNKPIIAFPAPLVLAAWFGMILPSFIFYPLLKLLPQKEK